MKTRNISLVLAGVMALGATTSCMDKLDIEQHGVLNYESYYSNDEEIQAGLATIYLQLAGMAHSHLMTKECLSGDFWSAGGARGDNAGYEELNEYRHTSENGSIQGMFTNYYTVINRCNIVIDNAEKVGSNFAKLAIADALVLRALCNFELVTMWGPAPLVLHELSSADCAVPNATVSELWAQIESDLNTAISFNVLEEKKNENDVKWHVTKQFAQALLGKALLWQGKKSEAATMFNLVVDSEKYSLYEGDYQDVIQYKNKNNCESVFELQVANDPNVVNINMTGAMLRWRNEYMTTMFSPLAAEMFTGFDWGFFNPTKSLYDAFVANEGENGYRQTQTLYNMAQLAQQGVTVLPGKTVYGSEGYFFWKWRPVPSTGNPGAGFIAGMTFCANYVWMRYSEVLLLAAEANLGSNDKKAKECFNKVRRRAKLEEKESITLEDIKLEKRCELCGEAIRYQDIQRWGDAASLLKDQGKQYPMLQDDNSVKWTDNPTYGYKTGRHELLPFPERERKMNGNLEQNPGW